MANNKRPTKVTKKAPKVVSTRPTSVKTRLKPVKKERPLKADGPLETFADFSAQVKALEEDPWIPLAQPRGRPAARQVLPPEHGNKTPAALPLPELKIYEGENLNTEELRRQYAERDRLNLQDYQDLKDALFKKKQLEWAATEETVSGAIDDTNRVLVACSLEDLPLVQAYANTLSAKRAFAEAEKQFTQSLK